MKKTSLLKKAVCAATATVLCVAPLLACGDSDNFQGVEVPDEKTWNERVEAYNNCQNFTETVAQYDDGKLAVSISIKYDIDNHGVVYSEDSNGCQDYYFTTPIDNLHLVVYKTESDEPWKTHIYYGTDFNSHYSNTSIKLNHFSTNLHYFKAYNAYSEYAYNGSNSAYEKEYESLGGAKCHDKLYFSEHYLFAGTMEIDAGRIGNMKVTCECSEYGTTVVNVPAEVQAIAAEYLKPNIPDAE
ncbi:MAG: hypothetical protein K2M48_02495 [Clostridiales bacterium]|nr:hypothetical protein [Clostridiales bacterium]